MSVVPAHPLHAALLCALAGLAPGGPLSQDAGPLGSGQVADLERRVFVELDLDRTAYHVGETVHERVRIGVERSFLAEGLVPLFRQPLDLPVRLELGAPAGLPCLELVEAGRRAAPPPSDPSATLVVGDERVRARRLADEVRDGATYSVYELERELLVTCPGEVQLPAPVLRFAWTSGFDDDLFQGRVPRDRRDGRVGGAAIALSLTPLPEEDRPLAFTGAIGAIEAAVTLDVTRLARDAQTHLRLRIVGPGSRTFAPPPLSDLAGWHVLSRHEEREPDARVFVYTLSLAHERVRAVPSLELAYFEPAPPAGYRTLRTAPVPVEVVGPRPADRATRSDEPPSSSPSPLRAGLVVLLLGGVVAALVLVRRRARRVGQAAPRASAGGPSPAAVAFRARLAVGEPDLAGALSEYLAARLGLAAHEVHDPSLALRLEQAGLPVDLAARTALELQRLHESRYGQGAPRAAPSPGPTEVLELLALVEDALGAEAR